MVEEDLYRRIVYGSGEDAVLSELFGLETPYSDRAEEKRKQLVVLERLIYAGKADERQVSDYQQLTELLTRGHPRVRGEQ
ncbi:ATP-binding protein [Streptomyces sp. NPDC048340]|uniref:ATP-binding protein n=1 Tax=Streptomyces sp. NPDC048340 TaxID=3365537 RepID=UPI003713F2BD